MMPRSPLPTSAGRLPVLAQGSRGTGAQRGKEHKRGGDSATGTGLRLPQNSEGFGWPRDHSQDFWQVYSPSKRSKISCLGLILGLTRSVEQYHMGKKMTQDD